jgi:glycosyltransferase involved in cell wall biosynthesis
MFITVFTPTYNRAHTLTRLYNSLKEQSYKKFEWLIVDDGSSDKTEELIHKFKEDKPLFSIVFIKNKHGGKHRAINRGLDEAKGELFFLLDSDDCLTPNALDTVIKWVDRIPNRNECAGLCGIMVDENGKRIGTPLNQDHIYMTLIDMMKKGISGDHADILFTDVFRKYKYPEFETEWHIAPGVPFIRMAKDNYKLLFFNEVIYVAEYMQDGLTKMGDKKAIENFNGYTLRTKELLDTDIGIKRKVELIGKYSYLAKQRKLSYYKISQKIECNIFIVFILSIIAKIYFKLKNS